MLNQQLILGSVYRLKLKGRFERHGVCTSPGVKCLHKGNGVFRLEQISTFRDLVRAGVNLEANFFTPLGIDTTEYHAYFSDKPADEYVPEYVRKPVVSTTTNTEQNTNPDTQEVTEVVSVTTTKEEVFVESGKSVLKSHAEDSLAYARYPIYKFSDVIDTTDVLYVPELAIEGFPEIDVHAYRDLSLVFHLGLFDKPALLDPMLMAIRERMSVYGIRPRHIKLYSTGTKWLNPDEYDKEKSLRQPTNEVIIPENAQFVEYDGKQIIIAGMLKKIVETVVDPKNEVAFSAVKSQPLTIDHRLFERKVEPGDRFQPNHRYYEVVKAEKDRANASEKALELIPLTDASLAPIGDEIMQFVQQPAEDVHAGDTDLYRQVFGEKNFILVPYGTERNEEWAYDPETEAGGHYKRPLGQYYYKRVETSTVVVGSEDNTEVKVEYSPAILSEIQDASIPLYRRLPDRYTPAANVKEGETNLYRPKKRSPHGTGFFVYENYVRVEVLKHLGKKFAFQNKNGMDKVIILDLADIISFASQTQLYVTLDTDEAFTRWNGRWCRYQKEIGGEVVTLEGEISVDDMDKLRGLTVEILGQTGVASRILQVLKDGEDDRNYYLRYCELMQEHSALIEKCAAYEKIIIDAKG